MVNCHASIKGLFGGMIVFSCTVISIILYSVFRNKIGDELHSISAMSLSPQHRMHARAVTATMINISSVDPHQAHPLLTSTSIRSVTKTSKTTLYSIAIVEIVNLALLIISLTATTMALIKIRKLQYTRTTTRRMR